MTGAPRSAYQDDRFVIVRMEAVQALGDYNIAGVWQRIAWRCEQSGSWRATYSEIADEISLSYKQVRRAVEVLRDRGWIETGSAGTIDKTMTFRVIFDKPSSAPEGISNASQGTANAPGGTSNALEGTRSTLTPNALEGTASYKTLETKEETKEETLLITDADATVLATPDGSADIEPDADVIVVDEPRQTQPRPVQRVYAFDKFWAAYPRKVGKQAAGRAWVNAMKRTPAGCRRDGLADAIVAAAERMRDDPNLPDTQFIPHPATWLNRGGWEDEPYPPPPMPRSVSGVSTTDARVAQGLALAEKYAAMDREEARRITGGHHE